MLEDEHFVCFIPFAALSPYTLWIVPKGSGAHFHEAPEAEMKALALGTKAVLIHEIMSKPSTS